MPVSGWTLAFCCWNRGWWWGDVPGSTPHEHLSVWTNLCQNSTEVLFKAHVQHSISLVEDQVAHAAQSCLSHLENIQESAWGGNDQLGAARQIADLTALAGACNDMRGKQGTYRHRDKCFGHPEAGRIRWPRSGSGRPILG